MGRSRKPEKAVPLYPEQCHKVQISNDFCLEDQTIIPSYTGPYHRVGWQIGWQIRLGKISTNDSCVHIEAVQRRKGLYRVPAQ